MDGSKPKTPKQPSIWARTYCPGGHLSQAPTTNNNSNPAPDTLDELPGAVGQSENIVADNGYYSEDNAEVAADPQADAVSGHRPPETQPALG